MASIDEKFRPFADDLSAAGIDPSRGEFRGRNMFAAAPEGGPSVKIDNVTRGMNVATPEDGGVIHLGGETARAWERNRLAAQRREAERGSFGFNAASPPRPGASPQSPTAARDLLARTVAKDPYMVSPEERAGLADHLNVVAARDAKARSDLNAAAQRREAFNAASRDARLSRIDAYIDRAAGEFDRDVGDDPLGQGPVSFDNARWANYNRLSEADRDFYDTLTSYGGRGGAYGSAKDKDGAWGSDFFDSLPESVRGEFPQLGQSLGRLSALANAAVARRDGRVFRYAQRQFRILEDALHERGVWLEDYLPKNGYRPPEKKDEKETA